MLPISGKLICHILDGCFINMGELLSNNLEAPNLIDDDHTTNAKQKQDVTQIVDWIQCYGTYIPMVSNAKPDQVVDLIDHLNLIIKRQRCF